MDVERVRLEEEEGGHELGCPPSLPEAADQDGRDRRREHGPVAHVAREEERQHVGERRERRVGIRRDPFGGDDARVVRPGAALVVDVGVRDGVGALAHRDRGRPDLAEVVDIDPGPHGGVDPERRHEQEGGDEQGEAQGREARRDAPDGVGCENAERQRAQAAERPRQEELDREGDGDRGEKRRLDHALLARGAKGGDGREGRREDHDEERDHARPPVEEPVRDRHPERDEDERGDLEFTRERTAAPRSARGRPRSRGPPGVHRVRARRAPRRWRSRT